METVVGKPRVLVVDDEHKIANLIWKSLMSEAEIIVETRGHKAYTRLLMPTELFDVVLLDLMMPDMSGIEIYELLAMKAPNRLKRIAFITGAVGIPMISDFLAHTSNLVVEKPFSIDEIGAVIRMFTARNDPRGT